MSMIRCDYCSYFCDSDYDTEGWRYGDDGCGIFLCPWCREDYDAQLSDGDKMAALAEDKQPWGAVNEQ